MSPEAAKRLRWFDYFDRCQNARQTCRYFGISAQTFYRWKNRFDPYDLTTLEAVSRRPHRVRQPQTEVKVVERILELRQKYPRWGKDKLVVLLSKQGIRVSTSTVGRVMNRLKERGVRLFLIPPRTPKLQCYVERANRTHREEFYEVEDIHEELDEHNKQLEEWDKTYNYIRPHQSLAYLTPAEYYHAWLKTHPQPCVSPM
jgi:transposase InsO family protein